MLAKPERSGSEGFVNVVALPLPVFQAQAQLHVPASAPDVRLGQCSLRTTRCSIFYFQMPSFLIHLLGEAVSTTKDEEGDLFWHTERRTH